MNNSSKASPQQHLSPKLRFEPGSYGDVGSFTPSIACLKEITLDEWKYHFVLVNSNEIYIEEDDASSRAKEDLEAAFLHKEQTGSDYAVAEHLKSKGYLSVNDFNIVKT